MPPGLLETAAHDEIGHQVLQWVEERAAAEAGVCDVRRARGPTNGCRPGRNGCRRGGQRGAGGHVWDLARIGEIGAERSGNAWVRVLDGYRDRRAISQGLSVTDLRRACDKVDPRLAGEVEQLRQRIIVGERAL